MTGFYQSSSSGPTGIFTSFDLSSPLHLVLLLVGIVLFLAAISHDRFIFSSHRKGIPEPPGALPIVGNLPVILNVVMKKTRLLDEFLRLQRTIGDGGMPWAATLPALGGRITSINRPEYIRWVQKTNFENYVKGSDFRNSMGDVMGVHGIFVADGEVWRKQRKMASNIFSVGNFRTHVQNTIQTDLSKFNSLMRDASEANRKVNLPDLFFRFTLSSFSKMAFSADIGCLPDHISGLDEIVQFAANFDFAQRVMNERFLDPTAKFTEPFSSQGRKMRKTIKELHTFCYKIIDLRMESRERGDAQAASGKGGKDLLAHFMDQQLVREELLPIVLNFLIARRDTTAQALAWLFWEFFKNPECLEKCREEIYEKLGSGDSFRSMAYDDLGALVYTQACFYEALRLYPSVLKNLKRAMKDDVIRPYAQQSEGGDKAPNAVDKGEKLPDLIIKAGETVTWQYWVMARIPALWGEDCEQFKPERFYERKEDRSLGMKTYSQYLFHAFNTGPRICLGQTLATYEGCAVVAEMLAKYDIKFDEAKMRADAPTYDESLTLPVRNHYHVRFDARDD